MPISTLEPDAGYMGDRRRGASMGRGDSGDIAGQLEALRSRLDTTESTLRSFAEGFEPGWYERDRETGDLTFTPNFPTPESRAAWVAQLEEKAAGFRARIAHLERTPADAQRFYLERLPLDSGGYDRGGAYWGHGEPLYRFESADGCLSGFLRADDRDEAKEAVREDYPRALFFR